MDQLKSINPPISTTVCHTSSDNFGSPQENRAWKPGHSWDWDGATDIFSKIQRKITISDAHRAVHIRKPYRRRRHLKKGRGGKRKINYAGQESGDPTGDNKCMIVLPGMDLE